MKDGDNFTAVHWARQKGHNDNARLLLQNHAAIEMEDSDSRTTLRLA